MTDTNPVCRKTIAAALIKAQRIGVATRLSTPLISIKPVVNAGLASSTRAAGRQRLIPPL
jgi:hypothetical protein